MGSRTGRASKAAWLARGMCRRAAFASWPRVVGMDPLLRDVQVFVDGAAVPQAASKTAAVASSGASFFTSRWGLELVVIVLLLRRPLRDSGVAGAAVEAAVAASWGPSGIPIDPSQARMLR